MGMMINRRRACGGGEKLPQGAVDMGLPSGTLWAQGNIVKDANGNYAIGEPSDYGCYFSWGNIDGLSREDKSNYTNTPGSQLSNSIPSNDAAHDAAVARIGNGWHMPTIENFQELLNSNNCTWAWTKVNNVNGYLVTSKSNGNTLFFPAVGNISHIGLVEDGQCEYYSSTYQNATFAYGIYGRGENVSKHNFYRNCGLSIRPVYTSNN